MAGEQILLVEDQRAVAGALRMRLRGLGYEVMAVASDGLEAIEKAVELQPDLILMDVMLGEGMDGIETAHRIRSHMDIPVVYVSAYANQRLLDRARETQPAGFINKPFTTKDLLTTLDLALHHDPAAKPDGASRSDNDTDRREAIITADLEGRVSYMNRAAEKQTGWKRGQVIGRSISELLVTLYGLQQAEAYDIVQRLTRDGGDEKLSRTVEIGRGGVRTVTDNLTPLRDAHGQNFGLALKFRLDTVNRSMADLSQLVKAYARAIDAVPIGVLLVNEELKLLHMNERGREIVAHNRGLDCRDDRLIAHDKQLNQKLQELVRAAAAKSENGQANSSDAMFVKTPFLREPIELVITPVGGIDDVKNGPSVGIYLFDTGTHRTASNEILTQLYGLTQTEAKLVQILVRGRTLDEAAGDLGISVNTARTHLKHVFHKTGINRQTELIHRIETGPAGLLLNFESHQPPASTSRK
jgi:PAS domain S-box-containing protein